jgi:hypothetical protein
MSSSKAELSPVALGDGAKLAIELPGIHSLPQRYCEWLLLVLSGGIHCMPQIVLC